MLSIFILITQDNWDINMKNLMVMTDPILASLFTIITMVIGIYSVLNLFLAILLSNLDRLTEEEEEHSSSDDIDGQSDDGDDLAVKIVSAADPITNEVHRSHVIHGDGDVATKGPSSPASGAASSPVGALLPSHRSARRSSAAIIASPKSASRLRRISIMILPSSPGRDVPTSPALGAMSPGPPSPYKTIGITAGVASRHRRTSILGDLLLDRPTIQLPSSRNRRVSIIMDPTATSPNTGFTAVSTFAPSPKKEPQRSSMELVRKPILRPRRVSIVIYPSNQRDLDVTLQQVTSPFPKVGEVPLPRIEVCPNQDKEDRLQGASSMAGDGPTNHIISAAYDGRKLDANVAKVESDSFPRPSMVSGNERGGV